MDPSIMKLLEEDEDESMHSGADVEAFSAALNRDIERGKSSTEPSQQKTFFSQEGNQASSQMYSQWQPSNQDDNSANQSHQQDVTNQEQRDVQSSSQVEVKEQSSSIESKQEVNSGQAPSGLQMQFTPMQVDGQGRQLEQNSGNFSQSAAPTQIQISGRAHSQNPEQDRMHNLSNGAQLPNMQRLSGNQAAPEQGGASTQKQKQIPFGSLLPIILPELDKDRAMQLQTLYTKLRRNEIPKDGFVRHMRNIVGDQMLRLAVVKMQAKSQNLTQQQQQQPPPQQQQQQPQQQHPRPPGTAAQFADGYSFGPGQKSQSTHPMISPGPPRGLSVAVQPHKDSGHQTIDSRSHRMQSNQMIGRPSIPMQSLTKQQQEHLQFSQSSLPMYGSYQPYPPSAMVRPQPHDPQIRQIQFHQGFGSAQGDGTSQVVGTINAPKVERQNSYNDMNNVLPPMGYVKQEPAEQASDKQPKPPILQSHGPSFSSSVQIEQGKGPGTSTDQLPVRQNSGMGFSSSMRGSNMTTPSSIPSQMDADTQVGSRSALDSPATGIGGSLTTSTKRPVSGQKKPLDAVASSPPLPSKKQKVGGTYADDSIEHLNDVTAVSGVNLREEEQQLFSIPSDDGRVSEASRKAVQEEEDRLILQKAPLKKKLAEIMTKCGLKNLSNDVERCLSLCVEERLRVLISSLIRISKQRADSEKSKHSTAITSDVREQILMINRKAREEWDKKQAEADKLRKQNEPDSNSEVDAEKEKDEERAKSLKVNKEEDDKMRTTAANVAARAAVGGDDMLSKWQLMAQARQKRDVGPETSSSSQVGRDTNPKPSSTSTGNARDSRGIERKDQSTALAAPGVVRQVGRSQVSTPPPRITPTISLKDVVAVLEREPQMAKSTIVYRLYDRLHGNDSTK